MCVRNIKLNGGKKERDYGCSMCRCQGGCNYNCAQDPNANQNDKCHVTCDVCYGKEADHATVNFYSILKNNS